MFYIIMLVVFLFSKDSVAASSDKRIPEDIPVC